jgi:hypothetical protein
MTPSEHYAVAEQLLKEGEVIVEKIRRVQDSDALQETKDRLADNYGKKAMGIWAQAQVHATLSTARCQ